MNYGIVDDEGKLAKVVAKAIRNPDLDKNNVYRKYGVENSLDYLSKKLAEISGYLHDLTIHMRGGFPEELILATDSDNVILAIDALAEAAVFLDDLVDAVAQSSEPDAAELFEFAYGYYRTILDGEEDDEDDE